jgi:hypothetical protein
MSTGGLSEWSSGPLAPLAEDLRRELAGRGYTPRSADAQLRLAAGLSRWLQSRDLAAGDVTAEVIEEFFAGRRTDGCPRSRTSRSVGALLECLHVIRPEMAGGVPAGGLLTRYRDYLLAERGLAASTTDRYLRLAAAFLAWLPDGEEGVAGLEAGQASRSWTQTAAITVISSGGCGLGRFVEVLAGAVNVSGHSQYRSLGIACDDSVDDRIVLIP